jgi:hypothetical protein
LKIVAQLATHISLHHFFIIKMSLAFKPLNGGIGDIIGITLSCGTTGKTECGKKQEEGNENNSEQIHLMTLKDPFQKAIREAGSTIRRGWDFEYETQELRKIESLRKK